METVKVATFNANSIRARLPIIRDWLERERPDVLCLQETKCQDRDFPIDQFNEAGYQVYFRGQKSYNGVAIITQIPMDEIRLNLYRGGDEDARFISARAGKFDLINIYVPQGFAIGSEKFDYKLRWLKDLLSHIRSTHSPGQPLLLVGDFNVAMESIDVHDPDKLRGEVGFHPDEQRILREYMSWGLVDIFRKHESGGEHFTFWDYRIPNALKRKMGWRIDYICATAPLASKSLGAWIDRSARNRKKPSDHTFLVAEFRL